MRVYSDDISRWESMFLLFRHILSSTFWLAYSTYGRALGWVFGSTGWIFLVNFDIQPLDSFTLVCFLPSSSFFYNGFYMHAKDVFVIHEHGLNFYEDKVTFNSSYKIFSSLRHVYKEIVFFVQITKILLIKKVFILHLWFINQLRIKV